MEFHYFLLSCGKNVFTLFFQEFRRFKIYSQFMINFTNDFLWRRAIKFRSGRINIDMAILFVKSGNYIGRIFQSMCGTHFHFLSAIFQLLLAL